VLSPGAVKTDIGRDDTVGQSGAIPWYEKFGKLYPVGRHGVGDDIANAVLYLASNESSFITGSVLVADGGHLAANVSP
jgi:NAD(P)-dependent dehydrogenase (short-subunit alcohol dehydrogenase family)